MSDVQNTPAPVTEATEPTAEPTTTATTTTTTTTTAQEHEAPATESAAAPAAEPEVNGEPAKAPEEPAAAPVEEKKDEVAPAAATAAKAPEKVVEPITEGQLAVKGPGLIKSIVPSKKEFWLSDSPVTPQHLHLYLRGEKPDIASPVVAWASQTGKGLLFFNKKGETNRTNPHSVLPLYDAADLKKSHPHEITFKLHGHEHVLKAANDAERDGWFLSLQRAIEVGKAEKESIRASEGYKAEIEKLNKPNTVNTSVAGAAAAARSKSQPKQTDEAARTGSSDDDKQKSRSTSRGVLDRLKGKKDDIEAKREEKKEEKKEVKDEKKAEKQEAKAEKEAEKTGEAAPVAALAGGIAALDAPATADRAVGAPVEEKPVVGNETSVTADATTKPEEKKSKRGSIFGRVQSGWSSVKSPSKEKDQKEAELKPAVPPKDTSVSETAPQIPEPSAEPTPAVDSTDKTAESTEPQTSSKPVEAVKEKLDELSPTAQKKGGLLSGLPFINKRDRSVSPSANLKEAPVKKEDAPAVPSKEEGAIEEPAAEEPSKAATETPAVAETPAVTEPTADATEKPVEKVDEPTKPTTETASPSTDKRASVFGNLGRRASKAFKNFQTPKKENATPAATTTPAAKTEEAAPAVDETPKVNGESKPAEEPQSIGDVVPEAVNVGQAQTTPTVAASA